MPFGPRGAKIDPSEPFYACPLCDATYQKRKDFEDHLVAFHSMDRETAEALTRAT